MKFDSSAECLVKLLRQLRVPATRVGVDDELSQHPAQDSLLALSDVLTGYGVPNAAYQIGREELPKLPTPFIAHVANPRGGGFILIESVDGGRITAQQLGKRSGGLTLPEFERVFTGHVLLANHAAEAGEPQYRTNQRRSRAKALRLPFIGAVCLVLSLLALLHASWVGSGDWRFFLLFAAQSAGLLLTVLLVAQSLGHTTPLLQRLCGGGQKTGCQAILVSKAARLTEEISWAEVGLFYFASTWLALLLLPGLRQQLPAFAWVTLLGLPFTVYSIYYQAVVARQWCVLCTAVQAILWVEFLATAPYLTKPLSAPSVAGWGTLAGCLLAPVLTWVFLKPYVLQARQATGLRQQLRAFKRNQRLFQNALAEQPRYELLPAADAIRLGNPEARHVITVVSSPACPPCARTHQLLDQWLARRPDLQVQVVFTVSSGPLEDVRTQVATHLMALNRQRPAAVREALHSWYATERPAYPAWASRYPVAPEPAPPAAWQQTQRDWCRKTAVVATPTILLNGQRIPEPYQLEDIRYFF